MKGKGQTQGKGFGHVMAVPMAVLLIVAAKTVYDYAAKHGETALDGNGPNSPFASSLVKRMSTPGLEVRRLFDLVRDDVLALTGRRQQPFSYGSLPGNEDFFFIQR